MSELIVAGFRGEYTADEVLLDLMKLEQVHLVDIEDAAVAARKKDGSVKIRHTNVLVRADAAIGSGVGLVLGTMLLNPLMCTLIGGVVGAAVGETGRPGPTEFSHRSIHRPAPALAEQTGVSGGRCWRSSAGG